METKTKKLIAFNYLGGKYNHLDWLLPLLNIEVNHYVEGFGGSFVVALNRKPSKIETINDINSDVTNFFSALRDHPDEIIRRLQLTPYSRQEYKNATNRTPIDEVESARKFYIRCMQSFAGLGAQRDSKGWGYTKTISRSRLPETINKWLNQVDRLSNIVDRLRCLQIENKDWRNLLETYDEKDMLLYLDPPYLPEKRSGNRDYKFEMSVDDHYELAEKAHARKGYVAISGYDGPVMQELYSDWYQHNAPPTRKGIGHKLIQECLWTNYDPATARGQTKIFNNSV